MTVLADPAPAPVDHDDGDELEHYYCPCDPDIGLCGVDLTDVPDTSDVPVDCVVCVDLDDQPCPRCGGRW